MPAFKFEAAAVNGKTQKGVLDADSAKHARSILRERGLTALDVEPVTGQVGSGPTLGGKIRASELAESTRQLSSLLTARLPLEQALAVVVEQAERPLVRDRFAAVRSEIVSGQTFSQGLAKYPRDFPEVYRSLIAAGEQSGDLAKIVGRLADYIESRTALSQKITLAFVYPAIVTLVAAMVIIALLTYVVPQVVSVFSTTKQQLPFLTIALIAVSNFLRAWWWLLLGLIALAGFVAASMLKSPTLRLAWHKRTLKLPLFGRLIRGVNTARFASTMAILTSSGVPLIKALEAGGQTLTNDALKSNVVDAISRVREGTALSRALAAGGQFPPMVVHMIASGEATGNLSEMLERTATTLAGETERRAVALTTILEPLLILSMGLIVLVIVLAVMLPIIEINQLVK
jgi:general secretion pathway protein F